MVIFNSYVSLPEGNHSLTIHQYILANVNIVLTMNITHWLFSVALLTIHLTLNHMTLTNESYEMSQLNMATFKLDQIA